MIGRIHTGCEGIREEKVGDERRENVEFVNHAMFFEHIISKNIMNNWLKELLFRMIYEQIILLVWIFFR